MPEDTALGAEERAELERLRSEVATLRSQVQRPGGPAARPPSRGRWRTAVATLLIVVGCVLAPLSVAAVWWADSGLNDVESFSSRGPVTRLFDRTGVRLAAPDVRAKPELAAADG